MARTTTPKATRKPRTVHAPVPALVLGEILCDLFTSAPGVSLVDAPVLHPQLGGAPANVAVQMARLGASVGLISVLGMDPMGERCAKVLVNEGVDVTRVRRISDRKTGLTLVDLDAHGERVFHPWRERSADMALSVGDVDDRVIQRAPILHTGTVSLRSGAGRLATRKAVRAAHAGGAIVSLDVNLRYRMFKSREALLTLARGALAHADVVKATDDEARDLLGNHGLDSLLDHMLARGPTLVCLTRGEKGAVLATQKLRVHVESPHVAVVDATGAGDAFCGSVLADLLGQRATRATLADLDEHALWGMGHRACLCGAQTVTAMGATTAMPRAGSSPEFT
jgi:fructokinase